MPEDASITRYGDSESAPSTKKAAPSAKANVSRQVSSIEQLPAPRIQRISPKARLRRRPTTKSSGPLCGRTPPASRFREFVKTRSARFDEFPKTENPEIPHANLFFAILTPGPEILHAYIFCTKQINNMLLASKKHLACGCLSLFV